MPSSSASYSGSKPSGKTLRCSRGAFGSRCSSRVAISLKVLSLLEYRARLVLLVDNVHRIILMMVAWALFEVEKQRDAEGCILW